MAYTSSYTSWSNNHRPTADDLNRIEANAEAGCKPQMVSAYNNVLTAINTAGIFSTPGVSFTSRTGRVKINIVIGLQNSSGSTKTVAAITAINGSLEGVEFAQQVNNGDYETLSFVFVRSAPVGVTDSYGFRIRATTAGGPSMYQWYYTVEDI